MYLGLDLGTSGLKALLMGADGEVLGDATAPLEVQRPQARHVRAAARGLGRGL